MEPKKYHNIRLLKAWEECIKFLKDHIVLEFIFVGTTTIASICVTSVYQEILNALLYEFVFLVLAFGVLFFWKSLRVVPERIYEKDQNTIELLEKEKLFLKEQLRPKLQVIFKQGEQSYFQEIPYSSKYLTSNKDGRLYTYRIGLINSGSEKVEKVNVRLIKIEPHPNELQAAPFRLQFKNYPGLEEIDVQKTKNPVDFVDIFNLFRSFKGDIKVVEICDTVRVRNIVPTQPYEIEIEVSSDNGGEPFTKRFQFNPKKGDEKSMLEMIG